MMRRPSQCAYVLCLVVPPIQKKDVCINFGRTDGNNTQTFAVICWVAARQVCVMTFWAHSRLVVAASMTPAFAA